MTSASTQFCIFCKIKAGTERIGPGTFSPAFWLEPVAKFESIFYAPFCWQLKGKRRMFQGRASSKEGDLKLKRDSKGWKSCIQFGTSYFFRQEWITQPTNVLTLSLSLSLLSFFTSPSSLYSFIFFIVPSFFSLLTSFSSFFVRSFLSSLSTVSSSLSLSPRFSIILSLILASQCLGWVMFETDTHPFNSGKKAWEEWEWERIDTTIFFFSSPCDFFSFIFFFPLILFPRP